MGETAKRLARRALMPLPLLGRLGSAAQVVVFVVAVLGSGTVLGIAVGPAVAVAALFLAVAILLGVAAWGLQQEIDSRQKSYFDCVGRLEPVSWYVGPWNERMFSHEFVAWVTVFNEGPTSEFTARVRDVAGVPKNWKDGDAYVVRQPLWETPPPDSKERIESGGSRRIKLAAILRNPRAFWFYTSEAGLQDAPGHQLLLGRDEIADIDFVLEVVNTGDSDQAIRKEGRFQIPLNVSDATFTLQDVG